MRNGNLFILGYEPENFDFIKDFARTHGLGGIILFDRNFASPEKLCEELNSLKSCLDSNLIICVDQEGGEVNRLKKSVPVFPSAQHYASMNDPDGLRHAIKITSQYLKKNLINTNLVPVCDVLTEKKNVLMKNRVFGDDPHIVSEFIEIVIDEYKKYAITTCAKHFPGIGSTQIDPHINTAHTAIKYEEFEKTHWHPFLKAISLNVDFVMTSHIIAENLDSENMATFSYEIVTEILQRKLGFKGVILTDDLCMGGVSKFSPSERALKALDAGHDMLIYCHNIDEQKQAFDAVNEYILSCRIDSSALETKLAKIELLKSKLN